MKVAVIGTGYVGLVTGVCLAEMGNTVTCVDKDQAKILRLRKGDIPIYEPGLEEIVSRNVAAGRLFFTDTICEGMREAETCFIAVGTPPGEDGSADLSYVLAAAVEVGSCLSGYTVVINKSTVPVGTGDMVEAAIRTELERRGEKIEFDVVSNPEFLKEGNAIADFMRPDRIIVGSHSERALALMERLYAPFNRNHRRLMIMGRRDAEMTKYAANAMLATKISFMNEVANLCERLNVDVENVRLGMGADERIGYHFIYPGCGYGGSCFPKDVKALAFMAEANGVEPYVLAAVEKRNGRQKQRLFEKVAEFLGTDLRGKKIAVWGLSFKPGTDDLREAPSQVLIESLLAAGARVVAHDPVANAAARQSFPTDWFASEGLMLVDNQYDALKQADALVLVTEWKPFRQPDFDLIRKLMRGRLIVDGRNQYDPAAFRGSDLILQGIGRSSEY